MSRYGKTETRRKSLARKAFSWLMTLCMVMSMSMFTVQTASAAAGDTPPHTKNITDNQDGTYTISLDIVGESEKQPNNVNVIVIFDRSGSMNTQRMNAAKTAVNNLANSLYAYNTSSSPDTVEMALVSFSTNATITRQPTTSYQQFSSSVNGLSANGGTNWEAALAEAGDVDFEDDDQTFVIFVSDGNPTFRDTRITTDYLPRNDNPNWSNQDWNTYRSDNYYYNSQGVYGLGSDNPNQDNYSPTSMNRCYEAALPEAQAIVADVGADHFFTIGAYGDVSRMQTLTTEAGAPAGNFYNANDTAALNQAMSDILAKIEMMGIAEAEVDDGTTNQVTTTSGEVTELLELVPNFKYYRSGGSYGSSLQEWTDAPEAQIVNGEVQWDLSSVGVLENGVKYTVTFDCYPSQTTYDIIAQLKNGDLQYSELDPEIQKYIVDNGGGSYSLRTNTNAGIKWDDTRDEAGRQESSYRNPDPVKTDAETLTATKEWEGGDPDVKQLEITVLMDDEPFHSDTISAANDWSTESFISIGIIKNGQALPGAEGHDFKFAELGDEQYHWELESPVVRPMLVDGTKTMLIMVDDKHPAPSGATTYEIKGKTYYVDTEAAGLTAINHRRSNLNLTKVVTGEDAPKDAKFPFELTVINSKAPATAPSEEDDPDHNSDYWVWLSIRNENNQGVTGLNMGSGVVEDGGGYYYAPSGTKWSLEIGAGWSLRFMNLPTGSTYTFSEDLSELDGFAFNSSELTQGEDSTFKAGQTTTGTIENTKTSYSVKYTNDYALTDLEITKKWEDADNQDGYRLTPDKLKAKLTLSPAVEGKEPTVVDNEDGTYTITYTGLPRFNNGQEVTYTVTEDAIDYYTTTGSPAQDHGTITNTHTPETVDISGEKTWNDDKYFEDGEAIGDYQRPESITINLLADGVQKDSKTVTEEDNWAWSFTGLPKYKDHGTEIEYTVTETAVNGYTTEVTDYNVANTPVEDEEVNPVELTLKKTDANTGSLIDGAVFTLTGPTSADTEDITVTDGTVTHKFTEPGTYTLKEKTAPDGYQAVTTEFEITVSKDLETIKLRKVGDDSVWTWVYNLVMESAKISDATLTVPNPPVETKVSVEKIWDDADDQDGARPDDVTVNLLANGEEVDSQTLDEDNDWAYTWEELAAYEDGELITYTVTEDAVGGYQTKVENVTPEDAAVEAGYQWEVTNSYEPEKTTVPVTKVWEGDEEWKDDVRPDSVTVNLLANGEAAKDYDGNAVAPATITADKDWKHTFENLPKYANGQEITYTVTEDPVAGYTTTYSEDTLTITNTYEPEPTEAGFDVEKVMELPTGAEGPTDWSYDISVTPGTGAPGEAETKAVTKAAPSVSFGDYTFTKPGTYTYSVTESGTIQGVENDEEATKTITVTVTGNKQGTLSAEVSGNGSITFTNTYKLEPDKVDPPVEKVMIGKDLDDYEGQFHFTIEGVSAPDGVETIPMPANTEITNSDQYLKEGSTDLFEFGEITYTVPGTYTYTISEVSGDLPGVTYNTEDKTYTMTVTVVDNHDGTVTATMDPAEGAMVFTNEYSATGSATLSATKVLTGRDWKDGESYTFECTDEEGAAVGESQTVSADSTTASWTVDYALEDVGTHTYTIAETTDPLPPGVTKSGNIEATVTVTDDNEGHLETSVTYADGQTITNTYKADPVKAHIDVTKTIDGYVDESMGYSQSSNSTFEFKLYKDSVSDDNLIDTKTITTEDGTGTVSFKEIEYTEAGEYTYIVKETQGNAAGYTYNTKEYPVYVTITDNTDTGKLEADVDYDEASTSEEAASVEVENQFKFESATVTLELTKTIEDQSDSAQDGTFNFTLYKDSVSDENKVDEKSITTEGLTGSVNFDELTFDKPGTYTYVVVEEAGDVNGMTYDTTEHTYQIIVDDNFDTAVLELNDDSTTSVEIVNVYKAESTQAVLKVTKEVKDTSGSAYDTTFEFTLTGEGVKDTATAKAGETAEFAPITYEKAGTYKYTIQEKAGDAAGYKYDTAKYDVTVTVEDQGGQLIATATYKDASGSSVTELTITNTYDPEDATIVLNAKKIVEDKTGGASGKTFKFELLDANGKVIATAKRTGGGPVTFKELTFSKTGTYTYTIREVEGSDKGYTYDTAEYPVTVEVTDDGEGNLVAKVTDGKNVTITNVYEAEPVTVAIKATKVLEGRDLKAGEFTFQLKDGDEVLAEATNDADGTITFDELTFTKAGTYKYTIAEVKGDNRWITYDAGEYPISVKVTDDGEGVLTAECQNEVTFTNVYEYVPEPVTFNIEATKVLKGRDLRAGEFVFQLKDGDEVIAEATNDADGKIIFAGITYEEAGTYEYTIVEVADDEEGITYDTNEYPVTVEVTDDGEGTLTATSSDKVKFTNKYTEKPEPTPKTDDDSMDSVALLALLASATTLELLRRRRKATR